MSEQHLHNLPSLRWRYITLASLAAVALIGGTSIANWYISNASSNSASAISINKAVSETVFKLRNTMTRIDMTVNAMLINPQTSHEVILYQDLQNAEELSASLVSYSNINPAVLKRPTTVVDKHINELKEKVHYLVEQRKKQEWIYPILPFINSELLIPNRNFISAVELSIKVYQAEDVEIDETYLQLQELRSLWQKKILNFRAVIVRFAGLNRTERTQQEIRIDKLHDQIETILNQLKIKQSNDDLELQVDASLDTMAEASQLWNFHWQTVRQLKNSKNWRGDVVYLNEQVVPVQLETTLALQTLEKTIHDWSSTQTDKLSTAARQVTYELWLFTLVAILFVLVVYMMIEKLVLFPIIRISEALSQERHDNYFHIEDKSSKEIYLLTDAFNKMRKQIHQRQLALKHQALHDALTGLPNRILFKDRLDYAIRAMDRTQDKIAVFLLDLNRFKEVNDTLGHHVGDELLQLVAERLKEAIRKSDTVARLGGDEFSIIAPAKKAEDAVNFANKINSELKNVFTVKHQNLYIDASIGIAIFPENGTDSDTLIRHADTAMYVAKYSNNEAVLYDSSLDKHTSDNLSLVGDLRNAIENNHDLKMFYQPQVNLLSLDVDKVEALLRWEHPTIGYVPPENIINIAEKTGLIKDLTRWIINVSIKEYMEQIFNNKIRLSINLTAWNIQDPDLPNTIQELLDRHKMPANMLTLEITETSMMNNPVRARDVLNTLSEMGIRLAIDDYGTGFSSLSYLKLLPMHELKIDKSFIFDMLDDENDATIVKSTIELAHNLGFKVVAEGVENQQTLLQLRVLKCDIAQGYHLAKPQDVNTMASWIESYDPRVAL